MKNLLLLALAFLSFAPAFSQSPFKHSVFALLDTNNIASGFNTNGALFSKDTVYQDTILSGIQSFRVPKTGLAHAIYSGNIWVAGKSSGNLYNSSVEYQSNYQAGPANLSPADSGKWNKIWIISRADALSVKNDFDSNHAITDSIPVSVLTWPAKGNVYARGNGGALLNITQDMAPFVDRNGDGVYNVYDGDYPLVRGDKMLWWINSDAGSQNTHPMGLDRRYSAYEYASSADSNLNNTLFLSVLIRNRSARQYDSVLIGSFVDFDLGCANNDRVGSIPSKNTFFVYNGFVTGGTQLNGVTCDEGSVCPVGETGYGCSNPIMTATFLNDSMQLFTYYTNGATTAQSDPSTDLGYYNYMSGKWNDGTPLTSGGNGYGGTTPYPFAFPGSPADASQWSECNPQSGNAIAAGDRRSLGAIGPFVLSGGDTISFDMAFIFHPGAYSNCPDLSDSSDVSQHIDSIQRYYHAENFPKWYSPGKNLDPAFRNVGITEATLGASFGLVPNPNTGIFSIHVSNPDISDYAVTVTDMIGRIVYYSAAIHGMDKTILMSDAATGVYNVTIVSQNYKATKRVIIAR
jgi:hypothetical protein